MFGTQQTRKKTISIKLLIKHTHFGFLTHDGDCSSQTQTVMNMSHNC